jgi:hypothetical protein
LAPRPRAIAWEAFIGGSEDWRADAGLAQQLVDLLSDTTDDVPIR